MDEEQVIDNIVRIKYKFENIIHILLEKEERKKTNELKQIKSLIDAYLRNFCDHEITRDYIDIGEKQLSIDYCHKCETTFH